MHTANAKRPRGGPPSARRHSRSGAVIASSNVGFAADSVSDPHAGGRRDGQRAAAPEPAAGIARVKSAKSMGVRSGKWLTLRQAQALLNAPDITTTQGLRDHAIIAVLLAVRKAEVVR